MSATLDYPVDLLTPSRVPGAEAINAPLLGACTLGVEVTEATLATRCGLGNIDPQHGCGKGEGRAAIEAALAWPLPSPGTRLVTIRADADALGAMAILRLRAAGVALPPATLSRARQIATWDSFDFGPWQSWKATRGTLVRPARQTDVCHTSLRHAMATAIACDRAIDLEKRVGQLSTWLLTGRVPATARASATAFLNGVATAWNENRIHIERCGSDPVAFVQSTAAGCLSLGYRFAPVVIVDAGDRLPRRVTIAQFTAGYANFGAIRDALAELEPGWGGTATILGAPQGVGTALPAATIRQIVSLNLLNRQQNAATMVPACAGCMPW